MVDVKICGLTRESDVEAAARAGAKFAGFLLAESARRVTLDRAIDLARLAQEYGMRSVAVLADPDDALLSGIGESGAFDAIQLHGEETPDRASQAGRMAGAIVIKAFSGGGAQDAAAYPEADGYLFDAPVMKGERRGGHGRAFDWAGLDVSGVAKPWFLAGGLNPDNVAEAIRLTGAGRVDVSSGVEDRAGVKNADLMRWFVEAARGER